jgi:hypothetical protein
LDNSLPDSSVAVAAADHDLQLVPIPVAACRIGRSVVTLGKLMRDKPDFPWPVKLLGRLMIRRNELDRWIAGLPRTTA